MTVFHWIRHAPTHEPSFVGWRDVPADLTETARVARLHAFLPGGAVLVSSDLRRSRETAAALSEGRHWHGTEPGLREFHFGAWDGRPFREVSARDDALSRAYWEQPGDVAPPGGESWNAARTRVDLAVDRLAQRFEGRDIIVVAHFGVILGQVQRARRSTPREVLGQPIDNLSVTTIDWSGQDPEVRRVNHVP